MTRLLGCLLLVGCGFRSPGAGGTDADVTGDAGADAAVDAPSGACTGPIYGVAPFTICLPSQPTGTIDASPDGTVMIDTDTCSASPALLGTGRKVAQATSGALMLCVFAADMVTLGGNTTFLAHGTLPLVLLAHGSFSVGASVVIDVSGASMGAGGNAPGCTPVSGGSNNNGGGGGAGGSFQTLGGAGAAVLAGGAGGFPAPIVTPTSLRGGCAGGPGGVAGSSAGGLGGRGGGAVYLLAGGRLQVNGSINASGAAGAATTENGQGGGGGGGAGGMIALWSPTLMIGGSAEIWANGGGGGGGSDSGDLGGAGGVSNNPSARAPGGPAPALGATPGGTGAINQEPGGGVALGTTKSGGGGGGSVGWIENVGPGGAILTAAFSPPAR